MYYGLSDAYKSHIKNSQYRQKFLLMETDVTSPIVKTYFDSADNDFTDFGISIDEYFCTGDDLRYGESPAATLSCEIVNENGFITNEDLGEPTAFIGVETSCVSASVMASVNAYVQSGSFVYTARDDGLYMDSTKLEDGKWFGLFLVQYLNDDGALDPPPSTIENLYAFGENGVVTYHTAQGTTVGGESGCTPFMYYKFKNKGVCMSITFDTSGLDEKWEFLFTEWADGEKVTYELCPMGVFPISGTKITSTGVISLQSVPDRMALLDRAADETIGKLIATGYPRTITNILTQIWTDTGVFCMGGYIPYHDWEIPENPFEQGTTYRQILGWIAELNLCAVRYSRHENEVMFVSPTDLDGDYVDQSYTINDIRADGYVMGMYPTHRVTGVLLTDAQGAVTKYGDQENPYHVYCNPLMSSLILDQYNRFLQTPVYNPISCTIINAEPWLDCGDTVNIPMTLTGNFVYADELLKALSTDNPHQVYAEEEAYDTVPILQRTFRWNGRCFADYRVEGNEKRSIDEAQLYATASPTVTEADLQNGFSGSTTQLLNPYGNLGKTGNILTSSESAVSVASGSAKTVSSQTLTKGVWLIVAYAQFASNATGYRKVLLSTTADSGTARSMNAKVNCNAVNGEDTAVQCVAFLRVDSSGETIYMNVVQNSGSALNVTPRFYALQIA